MRRRLSIIVALAIVALVVLLLFSGLFDIYKGDKNNKPSVKITYPLKGATISQIVTISGTASDSDGDDTLDLVEIYINDEWKSVDGTTRWSYTWELYDAEDGLYTIAVRSYDGIDYSNNVELDLRIKNPETKETDSHKWALFVSAANFPKDNESKLGNGALNIAEEMAMYFMSQYGYSTDNIYILFDDGWIRAKNGYGEPIKTLQERSHGYDITYAGAFTETFGLTINHIIDEANKFDDSEVFIWLAGHGAGDINNSITGGKILERSEVFLWDDTVSDKDLGNLLSGLRSDKVCVIVDTCFSGGFADKTIFSLPEFLLLRSKLPRQGRVIITGASKFRPGYASTTAGPLFTQLWFDGIKSGNADGYRPGLLDRGRKTILRLFKDGKVSAEEAFFYAKYMLRTDKTLEDYSKMQPQINDKYPRGGFLGSLKGLVLGE